MSGDFGNTLIMGRGELLRGRRRGRSEIARALSFHPLFFVAFDKEKWKEPNDENKLNAGQGNNSTKLIKNDNFSPLDLPLAAGGDDREIRVNPVDHRLAELIDAVPGHLAEVGAFQPFFPEQGPGQIK